MLPPSLFPKNPSAKSFLKPLNRLEQNSTSPQKKVFRQQKLLPLLVLLHLLVFTLQNPESKSPDPVHFFVMENVLSSMNPTDPKPAKIFNQKVTNVIKPENASIFHPLNFKTANPHHKYANRHWDTI